MFGFGKNPKTQEDLDSNYYKRQQAYLKGREDERLKIAAQRGREDAQRRANQKPFYQKVIGVGKAIGKDLAAGSGQKRNGGMGNIFVIPENDPFGFKPASGKRRSGKRRKKR